MKKQTTLVAALVMGLALPAFAQDGFRVGLSTGAMKTTGDAASFGFTQSNGGGNSTISFMNIKQPNQAPISLDLAIVKGDDEWSFTYFTTKKTAGKTVIDPSNGVSIGIFFGGNAGLTASRKLQATIVDLDWKHTLVKGDKGAFAVSTGVRYSDQSDERSYQQLDASGNPSNTGFHIKGSGIGFGLSAGMHGRMNLNSSMWMSSGFTATLLSDKDKTADYTISNTGSTNTTRFFSDDVQKSLLQTDAYLRFNVNFASTFNGYLGYEVRDFNSEAAKINNLYTNLGAPGASGFGLSGFTLGLSYTF